MQEIEKLKVSFFDMIKMIFGLRTQCCAELPDGHGGYTYCIRTKFHFGKHQTYNGEKF